MLKAAQGKKLKTPHKKTNGAATVKATPQIGYL